MIIISQVSSMEQLEAHFEISFIGNFVPNYRIDREGEAYIITSVDRYKFSKFNFGMIPFWSKQRMIHFEAPIEGDAGIQSHGEKIKKRIIQTPTFRKPIRETRCLIPVDYFIIPSKLGDVYLFFSTWSRPFALAGVYDSWKANYMDETFYNGFAILTTPATPYLQSLGIDRLPLAIPHSKYKKWINQEATLTEITALMNPLTEMEFNGYLINRSAYLNRLDSRELCRPQGDLIFRNDEQDTDGIISKLKSFRYRRGVTHNQNNQEERIWRG